MYRDNLEALRARVASLEAQLELEVRRRLAMEAEVQVVQTMARERRLGSGQPKGTLPAKPLIWPLIFVIALSVVASLAMSFRAAQYHRSRRSVVLHRVDTVRCPYLRHRQRIEAHPTWRAMRGPRVTRDASSAAGVSPR